MEIDKSKIDFYFTKGRWENVKVIPQKNEKYMVVLKTDGIPKHIILQDATIEEAIVCATLNDIALINS